MAPIALDSQQRQLPLALDPPTSLQAESAMRGVYRCMRISSRLTFEQVMSDTSLAICVRNLADAALRRHAHGIPVHDDTRTTS
jgi:hypothetical protein